MKRFAPLASAACLAAAALTAHAAPASPDPAAQPSRGEAQAARQFNLLDANGDGYLQRGEVALFPRLAERFDAADADRDGKVGFEELRAFVAKERAARDVARAALEKAAPAHASADTATQPAAAPPAAATAVQQPGW